MISKIRFRADTAANWAANNPVLAIAEPGYETDTGRYKIGDGVSTWSTLAYVFESTSLWQSGLGEKSIQTKNTGCEAIGKNSVASGKNCIANSDYSFAEGFTSKTVIDTADVELHGQASHAEGSFTTAKGTASHAEGNGTLAIGKHSHAEGATTTTEGDDSHAEGNNTITNNFAEHAEGCYNVSHKNSETFGDALNTHHSVGIGTASQSVEFENNKNAVEIMENGDQYILGIGGYNGKTVENTQTVQEVISNLIYAVSELESKQMIFAEAEPTSETVGKVGQFLTCKVEETRKLFLCTLADNGEYTWEEV